MKPIGSFALLSSIIALGAATVAAAAIGPPHIAVEPVTDTYGTVQVVDPYRWMERGAADPRFLPMLRAQNAYTQSLLAPLEAQRDALLARLTALSQGVARIDGWQQDGDTLFYEELGRSQSVPSLRVRDPGGAVRTLFDPATSVDPSTHASVAYFVPSDDGSRVAIGVADGGSEKATLRVVDVKTAALLPDALTRADAGSPSWLDDGRSFYYSRLQELAANADPVAKYQNMRVYLHALGSDPDRDVAVFGPGVPGTPAIPAYGFNQVSVVPHTPYLIAGHSAGTTEPGAVFLSDDRGKSWSSLITPAEHLATSGSAPFAVRGSKLYALFQDVPNGRLVSYDLAHPHAAPITIEPVSEKIIDGVFATANGLYVEYRDGLHFTLEKIDDAGKRIGTVPLPYPGTIGEVDANPLQPGIRFGLDSWTRSNVLLAYDERSGKTTDTGVIPKDPSDVSHVVASEVTVPSTDGANVPISIITRDDIVLDGSHPTLFEGYGSYGIPIDPAFSATELEWVRRGGVIAWAHVRGGGEYGERWHIAGQKATKQHTVDDMIATARYLVAQKYTSREHLAVRGTSAGGIAVGNAIVQHPELFGAAVDNVGATNLLRQQITPGGPANVPEFGDATIPADFAYMYPLDAYEHVRNGTPYPAVMGVTGVNDPRVSTWIVAKMIARLQAATSSGKPVVLRADFDAGHGIGSSRTQALAERADEWTFLLWQLGDPGFQPK